MREAIKVVLETMLSWGIKGKPCQLEQPLRLSWLASRDPFVEADLFRTQRIPSSVYDLVAWEVDYIRMLLSHLDVAYSYVQHPPQLSKCHIVVYSRNQFKKAEIRRGLRAAKP